MQDKPRYSRVSDIFTLDTFVKIPITLPSLFPKMNVGFNTVPSALNFN